MAKCTGYKCICRARIYTTQSTARSPQQDIDYLKLISIKSSASLFNAADFVLLHYLGHIGKTESTRGEQLSRSRLFTPDLRTPLNYDWLRAWYFQPQGSLPSLSRY